MSIIVRSLVGALAAALAICLALLAFGCGQEEAEQARPQQPQLLAGPAPEQINILLITIDTLRGDYLGCYGQEQVSTPQIDRMAAEGALFTYCVAHNTITLPSHTNILTGTDARIHGVHDNADFRVQPEAVTLAEVLGEAGYETAAFVGAFILDSRFGLDQGFDLYDDYYGTGRPGNPLVYERPAEEVVQPALQWISGRGEAQWFAWVHVYDPHWPHHVPESYPGTYGNNIYAGEISYVDYAFAPLFDHLRGNGQLDSTLVVITADHGEGLDEHQERTHGIFAYNTTLWIPLIIRAPWRIPAGVVIERRVRHIDLLPTILEFAGAPLPDPAQGESLLSLFSPSGPSPAPDSYFEALTAMLNRGWAPLRGVFHEQWKLIDLPIPELYDMSTDFMETENAIGSRAGTASTLRAILGHLRQAEGEGESARQRVDADTRRGLADLGYLSGPSHSERERYGPEDDPKEKIDLNNRLADGITAASDGRSAEAEEILRGIIAEDPGMAIACQHLGALLVDTGRAQEAVTLLENALARGVGVEQLSLRLAMALQETGDFARSVEILESLYSQSPDNLDIVHFLAMGAAGLGQVRRAERLFQEVLRQDPSFIEASGNLGWLLLEQGRNEEALLHFDTALAQYDRHAASLHGRGLILDRLGRRDEALDCYRRALESDPRRYACLLQLAILLTRMEDFRSAIPLLERFLAEAPVVTFAREREGAATLLARLRQHISNNE